MRVGRPSSTSPLNTSASHHYRRQPKAFDQVRCESCGCALQNRAHHFALAKACIAQKIVKRVKRCVTRDLITALLRAILLRGLLQPSSEVGIAMGRTGCSPSRCLRFFNLDGRLCDYVLQYKPVLARAPVDTADSIADADLDRRPHRIDPFACSAVWSVDHVQSQTNHEINACRRRWDSSRGRQHGACFGPGPAICGDKRSP